MIPTLPPPQHDPVSMALYTLMVVAGLGMVRVFRQPLPGKNIGAALAAIIAVTVAAIVVALGTEEDWERSCSEPSQSSPSSNADSCEFHER